MIVTIYAVFPRERKPRKFIFNAADEDEIIGLKEQLCDNEPKARIVKVEVSKL